MRLIASVSVVGEPEALLDEDKVPFYLHRANWGQATAALDKARKHHGMSAQTAADFKANWKQNLAQLRIYAPRKQTRDSYGREYAAIYSQFKAGAGGSLGLVKCTYDVTGFQWVPSTWANPLFFARKVGHGKPKPPKAKGSWYNNYRTTAAGRYKAYVKAAKAAAAPAVYARPAWTNNFLRARELRAAKRTDRAKATAVAPAVYARPAWTNNVLRARDMRAARQAEVSSPRSLRRSRRAQKSAPFEFEPTAYDRSPLVKNFLRARAAREAAAQAASRAPPTVSLTPRRRKAAPPRVGGLRGPRGRTATKERFLRSYEDALGVVHREMKQKKARQVQQRLERLTRQQEALLAPRRAYDGVPRPRQAYGYDPDDHKRKRNWLARNNNNNSRPAKRLRAYV